MELSDSNFLNPNISRAELTSTSVDLGKVAKKEEKVSVSDRLHQIATTLFKNQDITSKDRQFLQSFLATDLSKEEATPKQQKTAKTIHKLTSKIVKSKASPSIHPRHLTNYMLSSLIEQRATAGMLLACDQKLQNSQFLQKINTIIKKKGTLSEKEITKLIAKHNKTSSPRLSKSGTLALEVENARVFYNSQGKLKLASTNRKMTQPIELSKTNQKLTAPQIQKIKDTYTKITNELPYNNIAPMLEFMKFYREASTNNPNLTLGEAFEAFEVSPDKVFDKYQSGDCVIVAGKLQTELKMQGFEAAITGQYTGPMWAKPPVPDTNALPFWDNYDTITENVHHCTAIVHYSNKSGEKKALELDAKFEGNDVPKDYESLNDLIRHYGKLDTKKNITNIGHILKTQIKGKSKMVLSKKVGSGKDALNQLFGIDLIQGNLFLNSAGLKGLKDVPLNNNHKFSLSLQDLQNPDEIGVYHIKNQKVKISHREALDAFVSAAQARFQLPSDFADNLVSLAQNMDTLLDKILINNIKTAKTTIKESKESYKKITNCRKRNIEYARLTSKSLYLKNLHQEYRKHFTKMSTKFDGLQQAIVDDNPKLVKSLAQQIDRIDNELAKISSQIEEDPLI